MGNKNKLENNITIDENQISDEINNTRQTTYVVLRDGYRVSDADYLDPKDPLCVAEMTYWNKLSKKYSHGEKVEIVKYDPRKHRVW